MFSIFMGLQNTNENMFHCFGNFVAWLWKSSGNTVKGVCTNLESKHKIGPSSSKTADLVRNFARHYTTTAWRENVKFY